MLFCIKPVEQLKVDGLAGTGRGLYLQHKIIRPKIYLYNHVYKNHFL